MNRDHLTEWSLDLDDDSYAQALAALGALSALTPARLTAAHTANSGWQGPQLTRLLDEAMRANAGVLRWQVPRGAARAAAQPWLRILETGAGRPRRLAAPPASQLAGTWRALLDQPSPVPGPRLALRTTRLTAADAMTLVPVLAAPAVQASGVFIEQRFRSEGQVQWRWPFTVATLPDDRLTETIGTCLNRERRAHPWPYCHAAASRAVTHFEILLLGAPLADALSQVLSNPVALRCSLVIVTGLGDETPEQALPLMLTLAERLSASGTAVVAAVSNPQSFAEAVDLFAEGLTHNQPLDVALRGVFGPMALLLADPRLLARAQVDTAVTQATQRLQRLPPGVAVTLSADAYAKLRVPPEAMTAAKPPRKMGAAPGATIRAAQAEELAEAMTAARPDYSYEAESQEASGVTELEQQLRIHERSARAQTTEPRYVQQRSFCKEDEQIRELRRGYVIGQPVMLDVFIGPLRADSVAAPEAFPEHRLPQSRDPHRLQIVLHEPRQLEQPQLREISLPRRGDSSTARFVFTPRVLGPFRARITVLHRGRVLQTVLLHTQVMAAATATATGTDPGITLAIETRVHHDWSDLGSRRRFDLAMVLNHTSAGEPLATAVAGARTWATSLEGIAEPVKDINRLISNVALSVADYGDGLDRGENPALLTDLACIGAELYSLLYLDQLRPLASDDFDVGDASVTHIQVINTRQDEVVPLEFIYDYDVPNPGAPLCPQHRQALQNGCCPDGCARATDPRGYVCPMGFWGLKKVIERHMYDAMASGSSAVTNTPPLVVQVEAAAGRDRLDLSGGALVGHSAQVKPAQVKPLLTRLKKKFQRATPVARDWNEWSNHVQTARPALLISFPHNEGRRPNVQLEIGGDKLRTLRLPSEYVRADDSLPPVVFLLGCDVVGAAQDFAGHIRYFRQAGAAVVVSTIATVFGAHAVRVGDAIVAGLLDADPEQPARIGELIRDAKRAALLDSLPMALCVVAFGDADWRL